jgi:hypothetical protein
MGADVASPPQAMSQSAAGPAPRKKILVRKVKPVPPSAAATQFSGLDDEREREAPRTAGSMLSNVSNSWGGMETAAPPPKLKPVPPRHG